MSYDFQFSSFRLEVNDNICVSKEWKQYKFPKQKSNRRRKKWRKNPKNFKLIEVHTSYNDGVFLYVSSLIYNRLKSQEKMTRELTRRNLYQDWEMVEERSKTLKLRKRIVN